MYSYTATIGRNFSPTHPMPGLRNEPMTISAWEAFIEDVVADMRGATWNAFIDSVRVFHGKGEWDGVEEESAQIVMLTTVKLGDVALDDLRRLMSENARHYGQDAIALTIGISELC